MSLICIKNYNYVFNLYNPELIPGESFERVDAKNGVV
jgi:hypothetical protein